MVGQDNNELHFRIKTTTRIGKLKRSYSKRVGVAATSLRFLLQDRRISNDDTPRSLKMEQDNAIKTCQEQTGGGKDYVERPYILPVQTALMMKPEPRLRALKVNPEAKATTKQEREDDYSGDGEEDGVVKLMEVGRRQAGSSLNRITDSLSLCALITAKHVSTLPRLVKTGLEWSRPPQNNLTAEVAEVRRDADIPDERYRFRNRPSQAATLD